MNRRMTLVVALVALLFARTTTVHASSLALDYSVTPAGPLFNYNFALILDNHDSSWVAGQGFDWLIFGDAVSSASPIADFQLTSTLPVGPWTALNSSSGFHNGPTFQPVIGAPWVPAFVGDQLNWSGTSATDLTQGHLLFSVLAPSNGAQNPNFDVATEITPTNTPEPSSLVLLGIGIAGMGARWLRRGKLAQASL